MRTIVLEPGHYTLPELTIAITPEDIRRGGAGIYEAKLRLNYPDGSRQFVTEKFKIVIRGEK